MTVTHYHKSLNVTDQLKVIPRFLPNVVGIILIVYLSEILPFIQLFDPDISVAQSNGLLWADKEGYPWDTDILTESLSTESAKFGMRLNTANYRHIVIELNREHVKGIFVSGNEMDEQEDPDDLQAAHSSSIASVHYAIRADLLRSLTSKSISVFREVSDRWHMFLDLVSRLLRGQSVKRSFSDAFESSKPQPNDVPSHDDLKRFFGSDDASFKSQEQEDGLRAVVNGISPLIVVLPTGGGKSLLYMLPAKLYSFGYTSIVIVPYVSLLSDLLRRCQELGINAIEWLPGPEYWASLVFVSADRAVCSEFQQYCRSIQLQGRLRSIFFEECHIYLETSTFRELLWQLKKTTVPTQIVGLTATLPPESTSRLEEIMLWENATYIRASTSRPEIQFNVTIAGNQFISDAFIQVVKQSTKDFPSGDKWIAFCRSREDSQALAHHLAVDYYHAKSEGREQVLKRFTAGVHQGIVATSALGTGVDISDVQAVFFYGKPYGAIDFVQAYGRAGRNGRKVTCLVMISESEYQKLKSTDPLTLKPNDRIIQQFVITEGCRRLVIDQYLDSQANDCVRSESQHCDQCSNRTNTQKVDDYKQASIVERDEYQQMRQITRVKETLVSLQPDGCGFCLITLNATESMGHKAKDCQRLVSQLRMKFYDLRRILSYEPGRVCFTCSLPSKWCSLYSTGKKCFNDDTVFAICLGAFVSVQHKPMVLNLAECEFNSVYDYIKWLGKNRTQLEIGATNAVAVTAMVLNG